MSKFETIEINENTVYSIYREYYLGLEKDLNRDIDVPVRYDWAIVQRDYQVIRSYNMDPKIDRVCDVIDKTRKEIQFDMVFLRMAGIWRENSHAKRKKVGCLIVRDNSIISDGYNGTISSFHTNVCEDESGETMWYVLHAETNAIAKLAKRGVSSDGATIYCTFSPCRECCKLIIQAGIRRLVYSELHSDASGLVFLAQNGVGISSYDVSRI